MPLAQFDCFIIITVTQNSSGVQAVVKGSLAAYKGLAVATTAVAKFSTVGQPLNKPDALTIR
jgi:hypothetical protein